MPVIQSRDGETFPSHAARERAAARQVGRAIKRVFQEYEPGRFPDGSFDIQMGDLASANHEWMMSAGRPITFLDRIFGNRWRRWRLSHEHL
jgi:hypothetical protein